MQQIDRGALGILWSKLSHLCREPLDPAQCPEAVRRGHDWVCLRHAGHKGQHMAWAVTKAGSIAVEVSGPVYWWGPSCPSTDPPDFSQLQAELVWLQETA